MYEMLLRILVIAYACVGALVIFGYWPTIRDLYYHKKQSANLNSYIIWTISMGIAFLYSLFILPDLLFRIVSGVEFIACAAILILCIGLRGNK